MTDKHTDNHPADLGHVGAQAGQRSSKFWWMFVVSTALVVIAMVGIFINASA